MERMVCNIYGNVKQILHGSDMWYRHAVSEDGEAVAGGAANVWMVLCGGAFQRASRTSYNPHRSSIAERYHSFTQEVSV